MVSRRYHSGNRDRVTAHSGPGSGTASLGNVLAELLDGLGIRQRVLQAQVLQLWERVAREVGGDRLAEHSRALSVKRETLFVSLGSSVLRHQMTFIKRDLIERLNILAGHEVIGEIRISSDRRDRTEDG